MRFYVMFKNFPLGKTSVMTIEGERGFLGGGFVNFINSK